MNFYVAEVTYDTDGSKTVGHFESLSVATVDCENASVCRPYYEYVQEGVEVPMSVYYKSDYAATIQNSTELIALITSYFTTTGDYSGDYSTLVGHNLKFFTSQNASSELPLGIWFTGFSSTADNYLHYIFGDITRGIVYRRQFQLTHNTGVLEGVYPDTRLVLNSKYADMTLAQIAKACLNDQATSFKMKMFYNTFDLPMNAPFFMLDYAYSTTFPDSIHGQYCYTSDYYRYNYEPTARRQFAASHVNLSCAENWYSMLTGRMPISNKVSLTLRDTTPSGISAIDMSVPVVITQNGTKYSGKETEDYVSDDRDVGVLFSYMICGHDLSHIRYQTGNEYIYLDNGCYIYINEYEYGVYNFTQRGFKGVSNPFYCYSWFRNYSNYDNIWSSCLYLAITKNFINSNSSNWASMLPSGYNTYSYNSSPLCFVQWCDYAVTYNDGFEFLDEYDTGLYEPIAQWGYNVGKTITSTTGDQIYAVAEWAPTTINAAFWESLIENAYTESQEIDIGEGSIGGGSSNISGRGGVGSFDDSSDQVHAPSASMAGSGELAGSSGSGLFKMYVVDANDLKYLSEWLSETSIFEDHSEYINGIISLKGIITPGAISVGSSNSVTICGKSVVSDSGAALAPTVSYQYQRFTLGSFTLPEYYGSFMDYAPYTQIKLYLPFAGEYDLDPSVVVGNTMTLSCFIDYISGNIVYNLNVVDSETGLNSTIYTFNGNCSYDIPITYQDYNGKVSSYATAFLGVATTAIASVAGGPVGAGVAVSAGANSLTHAIEGMRDPGKFGEVGMLGKNNGFMAPRSAHLIVKRPRVVTPDTYGHDVGYPCNISGRVSEFSGFTVMNDIHLDGVTGATEAELTEIKSLISSGIIV